MNDATAATSGDNGGTDTGAAGNNPAPWNSGFDEDTSAYIQNKGWQSPTDILTSYRALEKFQGGSKNLLELPGVDAEPEAWDAVYNKLGRPESADKYELSLPENGDRELADWFKQTAHKTGLTAKQAQSLYESYNEVLGQKTQQSQQALMQQSEQAVTELKKEWGQAFDTQIDAGRRAVQALGYDEAKLANVEQKLGTAEMLRLFAAVGSKMGEDSFESGDRSDAGFGVTPAAARQQIADLKMDKNFMGEYMSGNPDAVSKMKRLMEMAHG
jgi:hypothetical protein